MDRYLSTRWYYTWKNFKVTCLKIKKLKKTIKYIRVFIYLKFNFCNHCKIYRQEESEMKKTPEVVDKNYVFPGLWDS